MVKLTAPMMSLAASGTLGKAVVFSTWKGQPYARVRVIPSNPRSGLQVGMRAGITAYPGIWNEQMSAATRALWNAAVGTEAISGFNLFTRVSQKSLRNNYAPILSTTDQDQSDAPAAPGDAAAAQDGVDMDITWSVVGGAFGILLFHSLTTPITAGIGNLIAVVRSNIALYTHRNPGVGTHYYDLRSYGEDGGVGALEGEFNGTIV